MDTFKSEKALVVFSGGQDSTTCLYWALEHFGQVHTLTFGYGHVLHRLHRLKFPYGHIHKNG